MNPTPGPGAIPPPLQPASRTLSDEALELAEFKVLERVQERLMARLKLVGALFAAGFTVIGFFGGSALVNYISGSVQKEISAKLDKEAAELNERLRKSLVDLQISAAEINKVAKDARTKVDTANIDLEKLSELADHYGKLTAEVQSLDVKITTAVTTSSRALQDTENLREAAINSAEGKPSILSETFELKDPKPGGKIRGTNFGAEPGHISVRAAFRSSSLKKIDWIPINQSSVQSWTNTEVIFSFTEDVVRRYRQTAEALAKDSRGDKVTFVYRLETSNGASVEF